MEQLLCLSTSRSRDWAGARVGHFYAGAIATGGGTSSGRRRIRCATGDSHGSFARHYPSGDGALVTDGFETWRVPDSLRRTSGGEFVPSLLVRGGSPRGDEPAARRPHLSDVNRRQPPEGARNGHRPVPEAARGALLLGEFWPGKGHWIDRAVIARRDRVGLRCCNVRAFGATTPWSESTSADGPVRQFEA